MSQTVTITNRRELTAALDGSGEAEALVVACPPHPVYGGTKDDRRLTAVSTALTSARIDCLRIDYGPWDGGPGERDDVIDAVAWGDVRYRTLGLFGYSFGATMAILAGAQTGVSLAGISALAPSVDVTEDTELDVLTAFRSLPCAVQVLYGERDQTVDFEPIVQAANDRGCDVVAIPGDHFFVGQNDIIAAAVADFFSRVLD